MVWAATAPYLAEAIPEIVGLHQKWGQDTVALSAEELRTQVNSPFYQGGVWSRDEGGLVDPARLAWGLLRVALELGVRVHEGTRVTGMVDAGARVAVRTEDGSILAGKALHATSAYPGVIPEIRRYVVPVYDYVLVTEPLSAERASIVR